MNKVHPKEEAPPRLQELDIYHKTIPILFQERVEQKENEVHENEWNIDHYPVRFRNDQIRLRMKSTDYFIKSDAAIDFLIIYPFN